MERIISKIKALPLSVKMGLFMVGWDLLRLAIQTILNIIFVK